MLEGHEPQQPSVEGKVESQGPAAPHEVSESRLSPELKDMKVRMADAFGLARQISAVPDDNAARAIVAVRIYDELKAMEEKEASERYQHELAMGSE